MNASQHNQNFVVATPSRTVCDDNARALENAGRLRLLALGTRRGTRGVPSIHTKLCPLIGAISYLLSRSLPPYWGESMRFLLNPIFDRWVRVQLKPGDNIISSYGHTNESFRWIQRNGGKTFLDAGNSHPLEFWAIVDEEHRIWDCPYPPISKMHFRRSLDMLEHVDFVLSPSSFVTKSFIKNGFSEDRILKNVYPVELSCFRPRLAARPKDRPLTLISTGTLTLRKGTPYLLEAFRAIRKTVKNARLLLTDSFSDSVRSVMRAFSDLPIEWAPALPHPLLAKRLQSADIFILPSLEEGLARTSAEALACGLPVITTRHNGLSDFIQQGVNGSVVPIRDSQAICDAALAWWEQISTGQECGQFDTSVFSVASFESCFLRQLSERGV